VAGAVAVVEAVLPQVLARQGVDGEARGALGEADALEGDVALEDEGVGLALLRGGRAEVQGAGCVGGAVEVLRAGVAEVDFGWIDDGAVARLGFVVDYGCVGAGGGDGVKGEAGELVVLALRRGWLFGRRARALTMRNTR
jgi:hypothetical protein